MTHPLLEGLDEADKEQLAFELADKIRQILNATPKSEPKQVIPLAPDGGPSSNAHLTLKTSMYPTRRVFLKTLPNKPTAVIRSRDFNKDLHEPAPDLLVRKRAKTSEEALPMTAKGVPKMSEYTREELLPMTIPVLKALPEVAYMTEIPDVKNLLVEAILSVREQFQGTPE